MTSAEDVAQLIRRIKRAKDLYEILGVDRDTDEKGLTKAYRKLAMRLHPDKCQAEGAEDAFKKISGAFSQLKDKDSRAHYDRFGGSADTVQPNGPNPFAGGMHGGVPFDPEEFFKEVFRDAEGFGMHQSGRGGTRGMPPGGVHFAFNGFPMGGAQPIPLELPPVIKAILGIVPLPLLLIGAVFFVTVLFSRLMSFAFSNMPYLLLLNFIPNQVASGKVKLFLLLLLMGASAFGYL